MADEAAGRWRQRCSSLNRHGIQCEGERDHSSLHTGHADDLVYIWGEAESMAVALNLTGPDASGDD